MGLFDALRSYFGRTEERPPIVMPELHPFGLERPDSSEMLSIGTSDPPDDVPAEPQVVPRTNATELSPGAAALRDWNTSLEPIGEDVFGITVVVDYIGTTGEKSRRRITLRHLYRDQRQTVYIRAICHERKAPRIFRFDRIQSVIDVDGVVHEPARFFADELRVDLMPEPAPSRARRPAVNPLRTIAKPGMLSLVALAKSDGVMSHEEAEVVLAYVREKAHRAGLEPSEDESDAALRFIRRLRPSTATLDAALQRLEGEGVDDRALFLQCAQAVISADGLHHAEELAMLADLRRQVAADPI